ncbi:MAG: MoxR family ATPase [Bacteroidia bacterium]|nr:MoxR family ATPase [Bacteroidia bacterium]
MEEIFKPRIELEELKQAVNRIRDEIGKVIVGQQQMVELFIAAILADGHVLVEGVPGIAKTLTAKLVAKTIHADFSRIQFTPDLMPSDILGTSVFNPAKTEFEFKKGPLFSNIVLIDEINRSPAKTQSALFEVMEERQITVDGITYPMKKPYLVFATQNPLEHEGTYRLPEAQFDRFLFKIEVKYPSPEEEEKIIASSHERQSRKETDEVSAVLNIEQLLDFQEKIKQILIEENLRKYIAQIVSKTRNNPSLYLGASPRASINIMNAAKAFSAIRGRDFVTPEDIQAVVYPVMIHRILLTPEKEMEGLSPKDIIKEILNSIEVPR